MGEKGYCLRCKKSMDLEQNFYKTKGGERIDLCKKCLGARIDNTAPDTFLWILEKLDIPYNKTIWDEILAKALEKDPTKLGGNAVLGRYIAKMKLKQWNHYGWKDADALQAELDGQKQLSTTKRQQEEDVRKSVIKEQFEKGEISQEEYDTYMTESIDQVVEKAKKAIVQDVKLKNKTNVFSTIAETPNMYDETQFIDEADLPDPTADLTDDDKKYLAMKWGTLYRPKEWIQLEQYYVEMCNSFDIQDADTRNTLKLLSKTTLKAEQALDAGDIGTYKQLASVADSMRKSAKFMANQRKEEKAGYFNSVGELVLLVEKEGGCIPRFCTDVPQDSIDIAVKDNKEYLYNLVTRELGFGQQIEDAIKRIEIQNALEKEESFDDNDLGLTDEDLTEYYNDIEQQKEKDNAAIGGENNGIE